MVTEREVTLGENTQGSAQTTPCAGVHLEPVQFWSPSVAPLSFTIKKKIKESRRSHKLLPRPCVHPALSLFAWGLILSPSPPLAAPVSDALSSLLAPGAGM